MTPANFRASLFVLLSASLIIIPLSAIANPVAIANLKCDQHTYTLQLEYAVENDDFVSEPKFPLACRLGGVDYKLTGIRAPLKENGMCGAQPPIYISLLRNRKFIISRAIFGENCFHGPAISSVTIVEKLGAINNMTVCVLKEPGTEPLCVALPGKLLHKANPMSQAEISNLAENNNNTKEVLDNLRDPK